MTILIFHQYFSTNKGSYGTRIYEFSKEWVNQGNKVIVITSVYYKSDLISAQKNKRINIDGIEVISLNIPTSNKHSQLRRIFYFIKYAFKATFIGLKEDCDIIVASSGPITTGVPGLFLKWIKKKKLVFEVRDLWPGVVEEIEVFKNKLLLKIAYWFEKICYINSDEIVCLSPGMVANIESRYPNLKPKCVYNSANKELFDKKDLMVPKDYLNKKVFLYTGNIGQVNNSILLIKAAKRINELGRNDIMIVVIGDGQLKNELEIYKVNLNLDNLLILNPKPKNELVAYVIHATACLIPLMDKKILDTSSPNKFYESLMAGIPVIQTTKGWIKELLEEEQCGLSVSPSDESELVNEMILIADNEELRKRYSVNAKRIASQKFSSINQANKFLKIIIDL